MKTYLGTIEKKIIISRVLRPQGACKLKMGLQLEFLVDHLVEKRYIKLHDTESKETRNSSITRTTLINRFNTNDAFVVPAHVLSGGLWLLWNHI